MKIIADFHVHSKYSRATSKNTDLDDISKWAEIKGVDVMATGDFTHPQWFEEIKTNLEPAEPGLFKLKDSKIRFVLSSEISCIYSKNGKIRKIHIVLLFPSLGSVDKMNKKLSEIGNLKADGRPILGLDAKELLKIALDVDKDCLFVPAHCLTPWFGLFGSKSGFDSINECFEKMSEYIYAVESGLSADPSMIWRIPDGRKVAIISNSDAHSGGKIGREANVFDVDLDYYSIIKAIKEKDKNKFLYTIEFYPEEGKYHYDGHLDCHVSMSPEESKKYSEICPVCGKPLTIGVLNRVDKLADKELGFVPEDAIPFKSIVPLKEILSECLGVGVVAKKTINEYNKLIDNFSSEFNILLDAPIDKIQEISGKTIAEGIRRARAGEVNISPGYDGVFGKVSIFKEAEKKEAIKQQILFR